MLLEPGPGLLEVNPGEPVVVAFLFQQPKLQVEAPVEVAQTSLARLNQPPLEVLMR